MRYSAKVLSQSLEPSRDSYRELLLIQKVIKNNVAYRLLSDPRYDDAKRANVIDEIFGENLHQNTKDFLNFLIGINSLNDFDNIFNNFSKILKKNNILLTGQISTVFPLTDAELDSLEKDLARNYDCDVFLDQKVDPKLIGGVVLEIDGKVINNSFSYKLKKLKA